MCAKKSQEASSSPLTAAPRLLVRLFLGETRPVALGLLILALFAGFWYVVWQRVGDEVLTSADYCLTEEGIEITPLPSWIRSDLRADGFRDASLDGTLSILDPKVTERIAKAFALHPWVAEVRRVQKFHPARVKVDLVYRRPVCIVQAPCGMLPVDAAGVLLPSRDFSVTDIARYPLLVGIGTVPVGPEGIRWGDPRVIGGAEIAAVLADVWKDFGLERIFPYQLAEGGSVEEYLYELYTRSGTQIIWGRPPGTTMPDEVPAAVKLARLKDYKAAFGTLEGPHGPQRLDVRSMRSMQVPQ